MTPHGRDYTTLGIGFLGGDPLILYVRVLVLYMYMYITYHTPYECREQVIEFLV